MRGFWPMRACLLLKSGAGQADTLVVCTEGSPNALNAQMSSANTSFDVGEQTSDRLVEMKIGGSDLEPGLATSWDISPDGLRYTFHLRHGVQWQSNAGFRPTRTFNADDVVFSFRRMLDPADPFYISAGGAFPEFQTLLAPTLKSIDRIDDDTVAFTLKSPLAPLLPTLTMQPMQILSAEYAAQARQAGHPELIDQQPIGTGPFTFERYVKDSQVRFRAFADFWGKQAQPGRVAGVDELVFSITPDPAVRWAKLRANECQIARYPNPADLDAMRADPDVTVQEAPIAAVDYIAFNVTHKPFGDKRVRQALAMAVDIDHLVQAVYQGSGTLAASFVPPALWGFDPALKPYRYDVEGARKLLAEAGLADGFATDLWAIPVVRAYMPNGRRAAEMIQADWAKIGVRANIVTYEWGEYLKRVRSGEADVGMLGATWDYPDPSEILLGLVCGSPTSVSRWCNKFFDEAMEKANLTTDLAARAALYRDASDIIHDDVPLLQFADVKAYVPLRKNVRGFILHFLGGQPFGGVSLAK